jgi:AbrB family looped-hinge helix DNA binding protein
MVTTIDKAGRVVIPVAVRERLGFAPGTEIEIVVDDLGVRLVRKVPGPRIRRVRGRWIAEPTVSKSKRPDIDPAEWIAEERERWP